MECLTSATHTIRVAPRRPGRSHHIRYDWDVKKLVPICIAALLAMLVFSPSAQAADPAFSGKVEPIPRWLKKKMTTWHSGCPVKRRDLRLLTLTHWDFQTRRRWGRLVIHKRHAARVFKVMRRLYDAKVRFKNMRLPERYGADDQRMMRANLTSAFNCRFVAGTRRWSEHAYGMAIDINPVQNPYVSGSHVSPAAGRPYVNRRRRAKGMIRANGAVVKAFASIGWEWGGNWRSVKDYMHFSARGR
jgi:hypothetical protein